WRVYPTLRVPAARLWNGWIADAAGRTSGYPLGGEDQRVPLKARVSSRGRAEGSAFEVQRAHHGDLIAAGELGAAIALVPYLDVQPGLIRLHEPELLEEAGHQRERVHLGDTQRSSPRETGLHQPAANPPSAGLIGHRQCAHLGQPTCDRMEAADPQQSATLDVDHIFIDELAQLGSR